MKDSLIWAAEEQLWTGDPETYAAQIDDACLMIVPAEPFILEGGEAIEAMAATPRWQAVELADRRVTRPRKGSIVLAYHARASRPDGSDYQAHCSTVWRRFGHKEWRVIQHQQTPPVHLQAGSTAADKQPSEPAFIPGAEVEQPQRGYGGPGPTS